MAVEPAHKVGPAVEQQLVGAELDAAEAEGDLFAVAVRQRDLAGIELRAVGVPQPRGGHGERDLVPALGLGEHGLPVKDAHGGLLIRAVDLELHLGAAVHARDHEHVPDIAFLAHVEPGLAVEPAVGQIVDHEAEGRDLPVLGAVELHRDAVVLSRADEPGDLDAEGGVAAAVGGGENAVDVDGGDMRRAVELQEQAFSRVFRRDVQLPAIAADHLIVGGRGVIERQRTDAVRQADLLRVAVEGGEILGPFFGEFPAAADTFQHSDTPFVT